MLLNDEGVKGRFSLTAYLPCLEVIIKWQLFTFSSPKLIISHRLPIIIVMNPNTKKAHHSRFLDTIQLNQVGNLHAARCSNST